MNAKLLSSEIKRVGGFKELDKIAKKKKKKKLLKGIFHLKESMKFDLF